MKIINLEEKLQKKLIENFDKTKPYSFFYINYGRPSQMSCKLVPSENNTIFITIVNNQQKERIHKTHGNINVTYSAWSDECDTPAEISNATEDGCRRTTSAPLQSGASPRTRLRTVRKCRADRFVW